ncbi:hypothetical protein JCGZ_03692 [Jatropha curcas]|uniref:Aminotransferase-like plant mobile domain-containing protein n=1 Tax=Jatropha curcas TaxID=180498 RepID=A0A067L4I4_JATCU|nr:hypothetical protein JCGZ_03692 [Jatropha curcas]
MSQLSEIPAFAYTPEMETLGGLPDIPTLEGEPVPVSRNPLTPRTRPLQLLPLPGTEFSVRYETSRMRGFQPELLCTSQNKGDPAVLACLQDLSQVGSFDWATLGLAHLYHGLDVWTRGSVWSYEYCIYPGGPSGDSPVESRRIPRYLAHCHHTYASGEDPKYWRRFLNDRELSDARLLEVLEYTQELENGRLRRHQSRQSSAVSRLQAEVERLRMGPEVEGLPLDSSNEDEDGSSSDDVPPTPPHPAIAGPSRRRR